jgi:MoxR-vWA-beta-propeller ternary system domain bpX0/MoxR-vWA-beta-propeller ternary system domain bpX1
MEVKDYFQSYKSYFWEWTTDEDVPDDTGYHENNLISVPNVGPIAYRAYIIGILKELKDQSFPPFGSLLLVLYAMQDGYLNLDGIFYHIRKYKDTFPGRDLESDIDEARSFLENIMHLGNSLKKSSNKIILLKTIFRYKHIGISAEYSEAVIRRFERNTHSIAECAVKEKLTLSVIVNDIETLAFLYNEFPTTESIINFMKGVVDIPDVKEEVLEEETTIESGAEFIEELTEEPKTFQVGSLIKRIWSGLKIPMRHLSPGDQPIGGISDMTNKGELHRMLLSEFAHDDEIFMNRVANNEALYIQREIPPEENIFERIILIDTSLKNWGTPKVLAFASAIAVIKHPKAHSECKVYALGEHTVPLSLNKVEDVIDNLNFVSPVLEVSKALEKFFNEEHTGKDLEVFFITHEDNIKNQNLQKVINENRDRLKFLVTTSSSGELNFFKHQKGIRKHIQKIVLPLKELWANPPSKKRRRSNNVTEQGVKTDVPKNYPLLFPAPKQQIATFLYEGEFFILSNKKQLLRTYLSDNYYNKNYYETYWTYRGCEVLHENISVKNQGKFALAKNKQQQFILCQYQPAKNLISKLNIETKEYSELNVVGFDIPLNVELVYFNKHFYLYEERLSEIFEINVEGEVSMQMVRNDIEIAKNVGKVNIELDKLKFNKYKILSNFTLIGINSGHNLVISKNDLKIFGTTLYLMKNKLPVIIKASQIKNKFTFSEGSEIITDSRGIITFRSINANIPVFYMPTMEYREAAIASDSEFGGAEYYLPQHTLLKVKEMQEMYRDYLQRFIDQILEYGTED